MTSWTSDERATTLTRIVLRPFGSPLSIGFFAFGAGVLLTAMQELGVVPPEDAQQRTVLPLFRRQRARIAIEGSLRDQIDRVGREAGVRHQL